MSKFVAFSWGVTSLVFLIYVNSVTRSAFLTGFVLSITTMTSIIL
ncbi:MAG: hypothetical protein ACLP9D_08620 [Candidatus Bathyarchaeia archaeon]